MRTMDQIATITYAQNREDLLLMGFFDEDEIGFYVDVGAEAPDDLSVTRIFYDKGWSGINIEPIKKQYDLFVEARPRDINLNIGIAAKSGQMKFREYEGTGYSTLSNSMKVEHLNSDEKFTKQFVDYTISVKTLKGILRENKVSSIQFLKIDVEGFESEVLGSNDWEKYRPEVICIEANHIKNDWRGVLKDNSYSFVFFDGLNEYYADDRTNRAERFNYVRSIVYKEPIIRSDLYVNMKQNEERLSGAVIKTKQLQSDLDAANKQIQNLSSLIEEVTPFRRHALKTVKKRVKSIDGKLTRKLQNRVAFTPPDSKVKENLLNPIASAKEVDHRSLERYTARRKDSPLLPAYVKARTFGHRMARRVITRFGGSL